MGKEMQRSGGEIRGFVSGRLNRLNPRGPLSTSAVFALFLLLPAMRPARATDVSSEQGLPLPADTHVGRVADSLLLTDSRFTVIARRHDEALARGLIGSAVHNDTFPGLPRPTAPVVIVLASDEESFSFWSGGGAPEWSVGVAIPSLNRVVLRSAAGGTGRTDSYSVLRHELAHLALHERLGALPPRWFSEGYAGLAAGEWGREQIFETSIALIWKVLPDLDSIERGFHAGSAAASWNYALSYRAVVEMEMLDRERGLSNFLRYWEESGSYEIALRSAYGMTGDAFNRYWKSRTRRRYGVLAFVGAIWTFTAVLVVLIGPFVIAVRRRERKRLDALRRVDSVAEAALLDSLGVAARIASAERSVGSSGQDFPPA